MGKALFGLGFIWALAAIWTVLSRYALGRIVQAVITALVYAAWLSIIPLGLYFLSNNIRQALAENRYGGAVFIGFMSLLMMPVFLFPLIPWNYFCRYVWRKVGLKLPQSSKLGGEREYFDWERER